MARENLSDFIKQNSNQVMVNSAEIIDAVLPILSVVIECYNNHTFSEVDRNNITFFLARVLIRLGVFDQKSEAALIAAMNDTIVGGNE